MRISVEFIHQHKTPKGGWNAAQLRALGVAWPPKAGWPARAAEREHSPEAIDNFLRAATRTKTSASRNAASAAPTGAQPSFFDQGPDDTAHATQPEAHAC